MKKNTFKRIMIIVAVFTIICSIAVAYGLTVEAKADSAVPRELASRGASLDSAIAFSAVMAVAGISLVIVGIKLRQAANAA